MFLIPVHSPSSSTTTTCTSSKSAPFLAECSVVTGSLSKRPEYSHALEYVCDTAVFVNGVETIIVDEFVIELTLLSSPLIVIVSPTVN